MPFINGFLRKGIGQLVTYCYLRFGLEVTVKMLDEVKDLGFRYATRAGLSIGIDDMVIPDNKKTLVKDAEKLGVAVQQQYLDGASPTANATTKSSNLVGDTGKGRRRNVRTDAAAR